MNPGSRGPHKSRSLSEIAEDISENWEGITPQASEWLDAMSGLDRVTDAYYEDSGRMVVSELLAHSDGWTGTDAFRIKHELHVLLARAKP